MIRPYADGDAEAVVAFFDAVGDLDPTIMPMGEARWRAFASAGYNQGARDFAVAEKAGALAGILMSSHIDDPRVPAGIRHFRIVVHPSERRSGVGRALLGLVETHAARDSAGLLQSVARRDWTTGHAFLDRAGFRVAFRDVLLERRCDQPLEQPPAPPPDVTVRPHAGPADHEAWASLSNVGFARDATSRTETAESMASYAAAPGFGLWIAEHAGRAVGFCHFEDGSGGLGHLQGLVVAASHEGRGIGSALVHRTLSTMMRRGYDRIELVTETDNERALRLYRRFGFAPRDELSTYRRPR